MLPGDDLSRLLPAHLQSLSEDLKRIPEGYEKWLYGPADAEIYQADVLQDVRTYRMADDGGILYRDGLAVIVSHTCDAQPRRHGSILIAPVFSLKERLQGTSLTGEALSNHLTDLRRNRLYSEMYLPEQDKIPESFVDFSLITPVSSQFFHSAKFDAAGRRVASLSQKGHYFFLMKLAYHFCRAEPTDAKRDEAKQLI